MTGSSKGADSNSRLALGLPLFTILHAAIALAIVIAAVTVWLLGDATSATATETMTGTSAKLATTDAKGASHAADTAATTSNRSATNDRYYSAGDLDLRARQINDVELIYPKVAYEMRVRGRVLLELLIDDGGAIDAISVLESEPAGIFEQPAIGAAAALKFAPAIKAGRPVKSLKKIEIVFDPYQSINVP